MPDFADDTSSELERKAKALKFMALFETVTYCVLFYFWIVSPSDAGKAVVGFVHGLVWLAFVAMTVIIRPDIGWTWGYTALVVAHRPDRRRARVHADPADAARSARTSASPAEGR